MAELKDKSVTFKTTQSQKEAYKANAKEIRIPEWEWLRQAVAEKLEKGS